MKKILISIFLCFCLSGVEASQGHIDLSGSWGVALDPKDTGESGGWQNVDFEESINLPSTIDQAGFTNTDTLELMMAKPQLTYLARKSGYVGCAWYTKNVSIPRSAKNKQMILELERVLWRTDVWVDGELIDDSNIGICTPQRFDLTKYMTPGRTHRITMRVDNRAQRKISNGMAHSYTDHTQIIWNGVIGDLSLDLKDEVYVNDIQTYADYKNGEVDLNVELINKSKSQADKMLIVRIIDKKSGKVVKIQKKDVDLGIGATTVNMSIVVDGAKSWSEFTPDLYRCEVAMAGDKAESYDVDFGFRDFKRDGTKLAINGYPLFLRGTLECCIFPLTGTPPMDKQGWYKVFGTAREWGLNHIRFHSWCPPKAAFEVADELGFYLQIELPVWIRGVGDDKPTVQYMYDEAYRIIKEYGNHPSFCMWALGNELEGDFPMMSKMIDDLKAKDPRHLYTTTSFTFQKGHGKAPESNDDFFVTQWTNKGWVRGQGVFNSESPTFNKNYQKSIDGIQVPLVTHEIGQYAVYPNMREIEKYTGVLNPINFKSIRHDLEKKGLLHKADDFTEASGKLAVILYKEEMERALKTPGISGFQLLDLHDFPGQGTALVGLLDAFWDSKGLIDAKDFRNFSSPIVPLASFDKAVYYNDEEFRVDVEVSNYSLNNLPKQHLCWVLKDGGKVISSGNIMADIKTGYNSNIKALSLPLKDITDATKLTFEIAIEGTEHKNNWNIWVYPRNLNVDFKDVVYTRDINQAMRLLGEGKKVLFNPTIDSFNGIEGKFVPVFWSPVHFPKQAGTMGLLCDPQHNAFALFPTDKHTNWQWWDLNVNSKTLITNSIDGGSPIVEMVDNFANNRQMSIVYQGKVSAGNLIVATIDLNSNLETRPVAKQMLYSLVEYMNSDDFNPTEIKNPEVLTTIFGQSETDGVKKEAPTSIY